MNEAAAAQSDDALLLAYLAGRATPCPACSYNIQDLSEPRCPECGEPLCLRVQPTEPRIAWPVAGLIGLSAGGGFSLMMVAFFLISVEPRGHLNDRDLRVFGMGCLAPGIIYLAAIYLWLRNWRTIRQATVESRRRWVFFVWILPVVHIILFALNVK